MRTAITFLFLLFAVLHASAQGEYNQWYFGSRAGINFNTNPPSPLTDGVMYTIEGSSGICDPAGNLLFYTNGDTVFNRNHQVMLNGLLSDKKYLRMSSAQGAIALPYPGNDSLYYIFTSASIESVSGATGFVDSFARYHIINMHGDGGLGEVIEKNGNMMPNSQECLAVAQHANNVDYWICIPDQPAQQFSLMRTVNGKLSGNIIAQASGISPMVIKSRNNCKFSPDSRLFASLMLNSSKDVVSIFRFDRQSGALSDRMDIPFTSADYFEFSPNSRYLYINTVSGIEQYDLLDWDNSKIINSRVAISTANNYRSLQLGPDGRIYCLSFTAYINCIAQPDEKGTLCDFRPNVMISPFPTKNAFGGPYYPGFTFRNPVYLGNDTTICEGDSVLLQVQGYHPVLARFEWNTGDTSRQIWVKQSGTYTITVKQAGRTHSASAKVNVTPRPLVYLGSDTGFCKAFAHLLDAGNINAVHTWNTGDTTISVTVTKAGLYYVEVKVRDMPYCYGTDTIYVDEVKAPEITARFMPGDCDHVYLQIKSPQASLKYTWSTGDTGTSVRVSKKGGYTVRSNFPFCNNEGSILVNELPGPEADLGPDTNNCGGYREIGTAEKGQYLWNTGETSALIRVYEPGTYIQHIERNGCVDADTIVIGECIDMQWYVPSAFTPNGDGLNAVFKVTGDRIIDVNMKIYNRWGELVFEGNGPEVSWDGSFKGHPCAEGAFLYAITVNGYRGKLLRRENLGGTVTLLR